MNMKKIALASVAAFGLLIGSQASATVLTAQGAGWCTTGGCNSDVATISNVAAGYSDTYRDFFNFNLAGITGTVTSATLSISNFASDSYSNGALDYILHAATSISYGGLGSGTTLASVPLSQIDTGIDHSVSITLNQAALAALQAAEGNSFLFGGVDTDSGLVFGYTASPVVTLTLQTSAVPEPSSIALVGLGIGAALFARRRKV